MRKALPFFAVAFSGFLVYLFDKIWGDSIDWREFKSFKVGKYLSTEISIGKFLIFTGLCLLIFMIGRKFISKSESYYSKKQNKLRGYNSSNESNLGILLRWKVYFKTNGNPFIADLNPFCTKHDGAPIRFMQNRCPIQGCENNESRYDEYALKNAIESELIDRWEKMK